MRRAATAALVAFSLAGGAAAQEGHDRSPEQGRGVEYPQTSAEVDLRLFSVSLPRAAEGRMQGTNIYLRGEGVFGLHLSQQVAIQLGLHIEPIQEIEPNGGVVGFRYFGGFVDSLYLDWRPTDTLRFELGKFTAPFGYGYHYFPGILPRWRAHEVYWIREAVGAAATWTFLSDPRFGEHDLSAAIFALDRSALSSTYVTRRRFGEVEAERYLRNSPGVGGPGNTGRLNNVSIALDGDRFSWLPNFSYHAAVLSRGAGQDGTAREWGYALGARYELRWSRELRSLFFAEHVEFRSAGGRPRLEDDPSLAIAERRRFSTLGVRTSRNAWRTALVWQRDERKRSVDAMPTQWWLEASVGYALGRGIGVDVGYQYGRVAREHGPNRLDSHAILAMLSWRPNL